MADKHLVLSIFATEGEADAAADAVKHSGAVLGKLHHKGLGLDDAERERIGAALQDGKAAVGVLADPEELIAVESILVDLGGDTNAHELDEAALREAADSAG